MDVAEKSVGRFGFCIRQNSADTKTPKDWATADGQWWM
jgi:hypothetical protein